MSALPYPKYSLDYLRLFPIYQTPEAFQSTTGQEPPPWDPSRPPKHWFDPAAAESKKRSIVYENVLVTDPVTGQALTEDGTPYFDVMVLDKNEAATVNIPPKGTNIPGAGQPQVMCPMRALEENEELYFDFGGVVAVKNTALAVSVATGFGTEDRALLKAIAEKLGV